MNFSDRDGWIWMDGKMLPWRDAKVHVLTHTLHYGMGVFEGIRAYFSDDQQTVVFRLDEHIRRLFDSAHILQMDIPFSQAQIKQATLEVLRENKLKDAYIRPICFYGSEGMGLRADGLKVHVAIAAWSWGSYLGDEGIENGIRIKTSSFNRHHVNVAMCRAKANGHYINSMLALKEAQQAGFDEALMLDVDGFVAEGSGENLFIVRDGLVHTPSVGSSLNGITSDTLLTLMDELGIEYAHRRITRDEVYIADEAFFLGTAAEITPIYEIDWRTIGSGKPGPITKKIQQRYFDCIRGRTKNHSQWLTAL